MVYDIDIKKYKSSYISGIIWIIIGIVIFVFIASNSLPTFINKSKLDGVVETEKITWNTKKIDFLNVEFYSAEYRYEVNKKEYICTSNYYGDTKDADLKVYYDSSDPSNCLTSYDVDVSTIIVFILAVPIACIVSGIFIVLRKVQKNNRIIRLGKYGTLIKRVPYQIYTTNKKVDGQVIKYFVVKYTFKKGPTKLFKSDFFVNPNCDNYGLCDLLVDEKDLDNFIIDFEIKTTGIGDPKVIVYEQVYSDYTKINY